MTPKGQRYKGTDPLRKTSLVIPDGLLKRLKHSAVEEGTDVSALLCRLAEAYLKTKEGRRR
jgi:hypothetical protein